MLHAAGLVLTFMLGCSARAGGGGGGGGGGDGGGGGADVVALSADCAAICGRLQGVPGCSSSAVSTCVTGCQTQRAPVAGCEAASGALLTCAASATPSCTVGSFPFVGCNAQLTAYSTCVVNASRADAGTVAGPDVVTARDSGGGDPCAAATSCGACTAMSTCGWCAGRCWTGTSTGPDGGSCGEDRWAWRSEMCAAPPRDAGVTNPNISPQCQSCAFAACADSVTACTMNPSCIACLNSGLTPSCRENPFVSAIIECACGSCAEACSAACSAQ